ncbi:hypothetical protein CQ14_34620 [Bradyrhizobium lablabi]|uniref:Uncharacterized protein n=1 Tax=Bradyrhizobium lablabi TaxID=722472 RepID=A0A0R3MP46_9BRAD|nr:hypothetical protein CQ14_34620 [Bradyrhizobium lablabi]
MCGCYPEKVTFSTLLGVEAPNILIKRDGSLRPESPSINQKHVTVLLQRRAKGGFTRAQYSAMAQFARVALRHNPLARIVFEECASPWYLDYLPGYKERWTTVAEAMRLRPTRFAKVLFHKRPLHPAITQRQAKSRRMR